MSGFPTRPSRLAFGPTRTDDGVVTDHVKCVAAEVFNLDHWQVAGLGVVSPRAWCLMQWDGAALQLLASGEAWDPNGAYLPVLARTGAGVYTITYAATYPNELGVAVATGLVAAMAVPQEASRTALAIPQAGGTIIDVTSFDLVPAAADAKLLVLAW
jgi:hypothetical protein